MKKIVLGLIVLVTMVFSDCKIELDKHFISISNTIVNLRGEKEPYQNLSFYLNKIIYFGFEEKVIFFYLKSSGGGTADVNRIECEIKTKKERLDLYEKILKSYKNLKNKYPDMDMQ